jgi:hypothetical protein
MATPEEQEATMIAKLPEQTGRSLDAWKKEIAKSGLSAHGKIVAMLKKEHQVTHGYANLNAHKFLKSDAGSSESGDDLVAAQYTGTKAAAKPIYDALIRRIERFGDDVELAPKKQYVSLRRSKQFGLLQPAPSRLDVGINLKGKPATGRLEASGSWNAMVSHRVRVTSVNEVDDELVGWLREGYEGA